MKFISLFYLIIFVTLPIKSFGAVVNSEVAEKDLHHFLEINQNNNLSIAYKWLDIAEEASARYVDKYSAQPTILSRTLMIWATSMYDAWAAYDDKAVGTRWGDKLRRPSAEHTLENKMKAISYASYEALVFAHPESKEWLTEKMNELGYDPTIISSNPKTPEGVAHLAASAVIEYRKNDGANQFGNEIGGIENEAYSDYTYYRPVNTAEKVIDVDRWQPITFTLADGKKVTPGFLTPHWYRVRPFLLESSAQFRPGPPPSIKLDLTTLKKEAAKILEYNQKLSVEDKALVEFLRDGPRSTGQSGHWLRFAQDVSRRDHYNVDQDVKLYFAVTNVAFDAFIACWETKRFYDTSRPWTLIHHFYKGKKITGWAGPDGGVKQMKGENWHPYSPESFVTPPFPGYVSGHAIVSGASSKIIELFTGTDNYGFIEKRNHCELTEKSAGKMITLDMPTWSKVAEMAALSRALGGYHIPSDNNVGLKMGREIGVWSWPKYQAYFNGTFQVK